MAHDRPQRVAHLIQQELGRLFAKGFKDPRIGFVTITGVKVTPDLKEGFIYYSTIGDEPARAATAAGLKAATPYVRHELSRALNLRYTPSFRFIFDEAIERGDRIDRLLREVKQDEQVREPAPVEDDEP